MKGPGDQKISLSKLNRARRIEHIQLMYYIQTKFITEIVSFYVPFMWKIKFVAKAS